MSQPYLTPRTLTVAIATSIQQDQLATWKTVLTTAAFQIVEGKVFQSNRDHANSGSTDGYLILRGSYIDEIVHNLAHANAFAQQRNLNQPVENFQR